MAQCDSKKITDLVVLTSASLSEQDLFAMADVSVGQTKSLPVNQLEAYLTANLVPNNAITSNVSGYASTAGLANTASYAVQAKNAATASFAYTTIGLGGIPLLATSASYATNAGQSAVAVYALTAGSAGGTINYAQTASYLLGNVQTANYATTAGSATTATSASYATTAGSAALALTASYISISSISGQVQKLINTAGISSLTSYLSYDNFYGWQAIGGWVPDSITISVVSGQTVFIDFMAPYRSDNGLDLAFYVGAPAGTTYALTCGMIRGGGSLNNSNGNGAAPGQSFYQYFNTPMVGSGIPGASNFFTLNWGNNCYPGIVTARGYLIMGSFIGIQSITFNYIKRQGPGAGTTLIYPGSTLLYSFV